MSSRDILRREFDAEEGSFLLQARVRYKWDWDAFRRLTGAMYDVADEVKGRLLLRLGSRKVSGIAIRGLGIIRATPISRDRRKKPIEMHWNSLETWLTSCLWAGLHMTTSTHYVRKPRANQSAAANPDNSVGTQKQPALGSGAVRVI